MFRSKICDRTLRGFSIYAVVVLWAYFLLPCLLLLLFCCLWPCLPRIARALNLHENGTIPLTGQQVDSLRTTLPLVEVLFLKDRR